MPELITPLRRALLRVDTGLLVLRERTAQHLPLWTFLVLLVVTVVVGNVLFLTSYGIGLGGALTTGFHTGRFRHFGSLAFWILLLLPLVLVPVVAYAADRIATAAARRSRARMTAASSPVFGDIHPALYLALSLALHVFCLMVIYRQSILPLLATATDFYTSVNVRFVILERVGFAFRVAVNSLLPFLVVFALVQALRVGGRFWPSTYVVNFLMASFYLISLNMKWPILVLWLVNAFAVYAFVKRQVTLAVVSASVLMLVGYLAVSAFVLQVGRSWVEVVPAPAPVAPPVVEPAPPVAPPPPAVAAPQAPVAPPAPKVTAATPARRAAVPARSAAPTPPVTAPEPATSQPTSPPAPATPGERPPVSGDAPEQPTGLTEQPGVTEQPIGATEQPGVTEQATTPTPSSPTASPPTPLATATPGEPTVRTGATSKPRTPPPSSPTPPQRTASPPTAPAPATTTPTAPPAGAPEPPVTVLPPPPVVARTTPPALPPSTGRAVAAFGRVMRQIPTHVENGLLTAGELLLRFPMRMAVAYPYYFEEFTEKGPICGTLWDRIKRKPSPCAPSNYIYSVMHSGDVIYRGRATAPAAVNIYGYALGGWSTALLETVCAAILLGMFAAIGRAREHHAIAAAAWIMGSQVAYFLTQLPFEASLIYDHGAAWWAVLLLVPVYLIQRGGAWIASVLKPAARRTRPV